MPKYPDSNCVFRLLKRGLVIIEHAERPDHFMIVRPASLDGSDFHGWGGCCNVGMSRTSLSTNAPPAMLEPCNKGWLVEISMAAAPGPGPVWFHEEFARVEDAVDAVERCFFGNRVDSHAESLAGMIDDQLRPGEEHAIRQGVVAFGDAHTPPRNYRPLHLALRSPEGRLLGGLLGSLVWDWLQIDVLWVDASERGRGYGRALLQHAEEVARGAGCGHSRLETFDFEARGFYERQGYVVYATLDGFPRGHAQFHLRRALL